MPKKRTEKHIDGFDIQAVKVSTRFMFIKKVEGSDDLDLPYITAKFNHLNGTMNIYPNKGSFFFFKHSSPEEAADVGRLIVGAALAAKGILSA